MGVAASGFILEGLSSCASFPVIKINSDEQKAQVPLNLLANSTMNIVRPSQIDYDIFISMNETRDYQCLVLKCTHQDWNLVSNPKGFNCSLHGSMFDLNGKVLNGPAVKPLKKLKSEIVNDQLTIYLV